MNRTPAVAPVYTARRRRQRGHLFYGVAGCILFLGTLCHLLSVRALESYRDAARAEHRMQARAAAEGAALAIAHGVDPAATAMGRCTVAVVADSDEADQRTITLVVEVANNAGRSIDQVHFTAVYTTTEGEDSWQLTSLARE